MLKLAQCIIENLIRPVTDIPITGWFETDNHITGTAASPIVEGRAHLWDGSAYGKLITNALPNTTIKMKD